MPSEKRQFTLTIHGRKTIATDGINTVEIKTAYLNSLRYKDAMQHIKDQLNPENINKVYK